MCHRATCVTGRHARPHIGPDTVACSLHFFNYLENCKTDRENCTGHRKRVSFLTANFVAKIFRSTYEYVGSWCHYQIQQFKEVAEQAAECFILTDRRTDEAILIGISKRCEALQRTLRGMATHEHQYDKTTTGRNK